MAVCLAHVSVPGLRAVGLVVLRLLLLAAVLAVLAGIHLLAVQITSPEAWIAQAPFSQAKNGRMTPCASSGTQKGSEDMPGG